MSEPPSPTLSDSALLDSLNDDPRFDLAAHRERRMDQLKAEVEKVKDLRESDYGKVITYGEEKKLIERMSKEKYIVVNFVHPDFQRCHIMDKHLEELAPKYRHTLFLRAKVADVPFLVNKFGIQVLPHVLIFADSRCVDRLIGFEELGESDKFSTSTLEKRLIQSGALPTGPILLSDTLSQSLLNPGSGSGSEPEDEDERDRRRENGMRRGKKVIRHGLFNAGDDDI